MRCKRRLRNGRVTWRSPSHVSGALLVPDGEPELITPSRATNLPTSRKAMQQRMPQSAKESLPPPTSDLILDVAQELLQTRGYNAISYQDIADRIGIRKASIHHHFPNKSDLAQALVRRYRQR